MASIFCCVTGFGSFGSVEKNPTQAIAQELSVLSDFGDLDLSITCFKDVILVSREHVDAWIQNRFQSIIEEAKTAAGANQGRQMCKVVFVHLGVSETSNAFALEQYAYNECDFRIPDVKGWQPRHEAISEHQECGQKLESDLAVVNLAQVLTQEANDYSIRVSDDPGRYVCNYLYYRSLQGCKEKSAPGLSLSSIFVHVPKEDIVALETQKAFITTLLHEIIKTLV